MRTHTVCVCVVSGYSKDLSFGLLWVIEPAQKCNLDEIAHRLHEKPSTGRSLLHGVTTCHRAHSRSPSSSILMFTVLILPTPAGATRGTPLDSLEKATPFK